MANIVKEIVSGYDVDGIHLDYIRYNHVANGWSEEDFARIAAMGADVEQVKYMINKTFYQDKLPAGDTHYIYFGAEALPAVYDLAGSIALLANCERTVSIEEDDETVEKPTHCSFCKRPLVAGRYAFYDNMRQRTWH